MTDTVEPARIRRPKVEALPWEVIMELKRGQYVKHPNRPEWGIGEVVDVQVDDKVRVAFSTVGFKTICTKVISLVIVEDSGHERSSRKIDIERVQSLCEQFYNEITSNRRNKDDGRLAKNVMRDLERYGELGQATRKQLLSWCHTNGNHCKRGVPIAREICTAIYGCIPPKER